MRVYGDTVKEELETEIAGLKRNIMFCGLANFVLTILLIFVGGLYFAGSILHTSQSEQQNSPQVIDLRQKDYVTVDEYNNTLVSIAGLRAQIEELSSQLAAYEDVTANDAQLISDFVQSQIDGTNVEPEFVENSDARANDPIYYNNGVISSDGYITSEYFEDVVKYYNMVPQNVRNAFESEGWEIVVTSDSITVDNIADTVVAVTLFKESKIYVSAYDASSIVHEMGHYIDGKNDFMSLDFDARTYASELNKFISLSGGTHVHNYSTTPEYFAESFSMYILKPDEFRASCPGTCEFIEKAISNI